jgi:ribosome-binding factor A
LKYRKHSEADGVPFDLPPFVGRSLKSERKTKQLCRQVYQALTMALGGVGDAVLRDLTVESVVPAPNASRLLVRVALPPAWPGQPPPAVETVMERLALANGRLRRSMAEAITRKRVPELTFLPVLATAPPPGDAGDRQHDDEEREVRP